MRHDRHLEEPPEHPDDCACRECMHPESADRAVEIMRHGFISNDDPALEPIRDSQGNITNAWADELAAIRKQME